MIKESIKSVTKTGMSCTYKMETKLVCHHIYSPPETGDNATAATQEAAVRFMKTVLNQDADGLLIN